MGQRAGLPLALLLGQRGQVSRSTREALRRLGVSHLLALSGLHLAILVGMLVVVVRPRGGRGSLSMALLLGLYVMVARDVYSLRRAYTMLLLAALARAAGRRPQPMELLAGAGVIVVLARPESIAAPSFQLSFAATLGAIASGRIRMPVHGPLGALAASVLVGACAQALVLPLVLAYFGSFSPFSPLATVLLLPPTALLMMLTMTSLILPWQVSWDLLSRYTGLLEGSMTLLASKLPPPLVLPPPQPWLYYAGLFVLFASRRPWKPAGAAMVLLSFFAGGSVF